MPERKFKVSKEELEDLYLDKGLTSIEIGEKYDVHYSTVCKWLKKYGIPRRDPSDSLVKWARSEEGRRRIAKSNREREYSKEYRKRRSKISKKLWQDPEYRAKQANVQREGRGDEQHKRMILSEKEKLENQGFRVFLPDQKPVPDMIATKEGKVYAIEVESYGKGRPDYEKYDVPHSFDDVIWIIKEEEDEDGVG